MKIKYVRICASDTHIIPHHIMCHLDLFSRVILQGIKDLWTRDIHKRGTL